MSAAKLGQVKLTNVRLSFPHLFVPTKSVEEGALKYRAAFLMDPETKQGAANIKLVESEIARVKKEGWKEKADKIKLKPDRVCLAVGDEQVNQETLEIYSGYEGMMVVSASNARKIPVVDSDRTPLDENSSKPYGGCYVNAVINIWANTDANKRGGYGIFATLEAVQFSRNGDPFGAAPVDPDDVFDDVSDEDEDDDMI